MKTLEEKVAIVTGAGQGVGQGIAYALADEGVCVAVVGRTLRKCEQTRAEIVRRGGRAIAIECDIKRAPELARCVAETLETFGAINILVNNAQEVQDSLGDLLSVTDEAIEAGWLSGAMATLRLMRLCYPYMKGDGSIVNVATTAAKRWNLASYGAYAAVKEAIRAISRAAACEWAKDNVRTNVIMPLASSPGLATWAAWNPEDAEAFIAGLPMRRIGDCEQDIGRFVAQLCGDHSRYVNGQTIALDGGAAYLG